MTKIALKTRHIRRFFFLIVLILSTPLASSAYAKSYECTEVNFVVNNNHNFSRQTGEAFWINDFNGSISINGGFLSGSKFSYSKTVQNKFHGSGENYAFSFDNGYFQWVKVSQYINELYIITANCR